MELASRLEVQSSSDKISQIENEAISSEEEDFPGPPSPRDDMSESDHDAPPPPIPRSVGEGNKDSLNSAQSAVTRHEADDPPPAAPFLSEDEDDMLPPPPNVDSGATSLPALQNNAIAADEESQDDDLPPPPSDSDDDAVPKSRSPERNLRASSPPPKLELNVVEDDLAPPPPPASGDDEEDFLPPPPLVDNSEGTGNTIHGDSAQSGSTKNLDEEKPADQHRSMAVGSHDTPDPQSASAELLEKLAMAVKAAVKADVDGLKSAATIQLEVELASPGEPLR